MQIKAMVYKHVSALSRTVVRPHWLDFAFGWDSKTKLTNPKICTRKKVPGKRKTVSMTLTISPTECQGPCLFA